MIPHEISCRCYSCVRLPDFQLRIARGSVIKALLQKAYQHPLVKQVADDIHHHRLMPGPACEQCIKMALWDIKRWGDEAPT